MLSTTNDLIRTALKTDPTLTPSNRTTILAAIKNHGKTPENPIPATVPECRIVRRAEAAHRLGRGLRSIDLLASTGVLHKIKFPGKSRSAGFLSTDLERLLAGVAQ